MLKLKLNHVSQRGSSSLLVQKDWQIIWRDMYGLSHMSNDATMVLRNTGMIFTTKYHVLTQKNAFELTYIGCMYSSVMTHNAT